MHKHGFEIYEMNKSRYGMIGFEYFAKGEMTEKEIIEKWKREAFGVKSIFKDTTVFHVEGDKLYLITKYPGLFIGYHGKLIDKYRQTINKEIVFVNCYDDNGVIEF